MDKNKKIVNSEYSVRTDLAVEAREIYKEKHHEKDIDGIEVTEEKNDDINVITVNIKNDDAAIKMGKDKGTYITIEIPSYTHYDGTCMENVAKVLNMSLKKLFDLKKNQTALVVGLGNIDITPDALGPKVIKKIMVTRHLKNLMDKSSLEDVRDVCAIAPGVLGVTGIETAEIIKAVVNKVKPDIVICIDALAARRTERVNNTIQICDTGISPGAGVKNNRTEINKKSLGCDVIAIGVPTVVDALTITNDTLDCVIDYLIKNSPNGSEFFKMLNNINRNEKMALINDAISSNVLKDMIVTPKEIDLIIDSLSEIISDGINLSIQQDMTYDEIKKFLK
ncbi:GPR endopeptidase [Clostridium sp. BJN0001]|uniref:GPR endopeptidase n=1 Tax=Clostridium sp. BJN0001 TaxID=2930219 RepID=UPI001FD3E9E6|nr:GPR endopeptidase [Clostridium sp. BJN0001]